METTADIHGTAMVLNVAFVPDPLDFEAVDLFAAQKRFMYAVFESKLKTDMGMSIVRLHEVDRDAQAVWRELSAYQMTSTTGSLARESLLTYLTTYKFDASLWKGSYVGFLVNWQDKMREYERLAAPVDHHAPDMKRTLLMQAVSTIKELDVIKNQCQLEVAMGRNMPDFTAYLTLVKSNAAILDQRALSNRSVRRPTIPGNNAVSVNKHVFEDEFEDYGHDTCS